MLEVLFSFWMGPFSRTLVLLVPINLEGSVVLSEMLTLISRKSRHYVPFFRLQISGRRVQETHAFFYKFRALKMRNLLRNKYQMSALKSVIIYISSSWWKVDTAGQLCEFACRCGYVSSTRIPPVNSLATSCTCRILFSHSGAVPLVELLAYPRESALRWLSIQPHHQ